MDIEKEIDKFLKTRCIKVSTDQEEAKILDEVFDCVPYQVAPLVLKIWVKSLIDQALAQQKQEIVEKVESKRINAVYLDSEGKVTTDPIEYFDCETCGAFLMEGACDCAITNDFIDELVKEIKDSKWEK